MKEFKIRSSACGILMTGNIGLSAKQTETLQELEARFAGEGKPLTDKQTVTMVDLQTKRDNPVIPETVKSYAKSWLKEQLYQRRKQFSNKYTQKGNITEDDSIDFIAEQLFFDTLVKNEEYFENDFITGTPDILPEDDKELIIDAKNSWDCFTFPLFADELPSKDYWWQGQCYMALTGRTKYKVAYVISDTPINLIEKEAYFWCRDNGYGKLDDDILEQFKERMTYSDVADSLKLKVFSFDRDDKAIEQIEQRVELVRNYIKQLHKSLKL